MRRDKKGQSTVEYAIVVGVVVAALTLQKNIWSMTNRSVPETWYP